MEGKLRLPVLTPECTQNIQTHINLQSAKAEISLQNIDPNRRYLVTPVSS